MKPNLPPPPAWLLCLTALLLAFSAAAQPILPVGLSSNTIPALGTNNANVEIGLDNSTDIALQITLNLAASVGVNSNITATLQRSIDGVNWTTFATMPILSAGAATVANTTNISVGAVPRLRISTIVNANTAAVQNLTVWRATKRVR